MAIRGAWTDLRGFAADKIKHRFSKLNPRTYDHDHLFALVLFGYANVNRPTYHGRYAKSPHQLATVPLVEWTEDEESNTIVIVLKAPRVRGSQHQHVNI